MNINLSIETEEQYLETDEIKKLKEALIILREYTKGHTGQIISGIEKVILEKQKEEVSKIAKEKVEEYLKENYKLKKEQPAMYAVKNRTALLNMVGNALLGREIKHTEAGLIADDIRKEKYTTKEEVESEIEKAKKYV